MKIRTSFSLVLLIVALLPKQASALSMEQFMAICKSSSVTQCKDHPMLQAYVGGSLDMIAMLDEETDYLARVYCRAPKALFDVGAILEFMEKEAEGHGSKNAMLLVIRYLEEQGGCR